MKQIIAIILFCCWASLARGQCGGSPCYTDNQPVVNTLTPEQAAAQGAMTATINGLVTNVFDSNGNSVGLQSHNLNATIGTKIQWNVASNHATSAVLYVYANGNFQGSYAEPLNGSAGTWTLVPGNLGDTYSLLFKVTDGSQYTQDLVTLYVSSGPGPSIISQDGVPENAYVQINTSGGGGSMMNDFTQCQLNPRSCAGATHTPFTTLTLNNQAQGTAKINPKHQSGNVANDVSSVSFGDSIILAANSNDILDFEEDDEVDCSSVGPIPLPKWKLRIVPYQIFDKVDSYDGKSRFQVEPWCYNCCIPAKQGCPEPITLTDHVTYIPGKQIPTFFYSLGFCENGTFPMMPSGQWECSPGLAIPFYGTGWIKAYCTPYETPPY